MEEVKEEESVTEGGVGSSKTGPALERSRSEVKRLEQGLRRTQRELEQAHKQIDRLRKQNEKLKQELSAMRQPPKWAKANKTEKSQRRAKKKGARVGHAAQARKVLPKIDEQVVVFPERCPKHGHELPFPSDSKWHSHIQIDLPEPQKAVTTEYIVGSSYCAKCKKHHTASWGRVSGSLFGPRLHATISYWKFQLGLTLGKIQGLLKSQHELDLSTGQISEIVSRAGRKFKFSYDDLRTNLSDEPTLYADETGWRVEGMNSWLWSFSSPVMSVYVVDRSRGRKVVSDMLGKSYAGVLTTDFYGSYNEIECSKQKCWAHLLRELKELTKKHPKNLEVLYFSSRLKAFFRRGVELRDLKLQGSEIDKPFARLLTDTENFMFRKFQNTELTRLAKRMIKYRGSLYTFVNHGSEPTNNNAEREIRPAVLMRKTSYGNRSNDGASTQAILMSMIRTCQKRNLNFVNFATEHLRRS